MQGGLHAARCIRRDLAGRPRRNYRYHDLGSAAYICQGNALLQLGPLRVSGVPGWLAWGLIHIAFLTGVKNRVSTVATWLASIARPGRYHRAFLLGEAHRPVQRYTYSNWDPDEPYQDLRERRDRERAQESATRSRGGAGLTAGETPGGS
jgi:NADH dehydrogenase